MKVCIVAEGSYPIVRGGLSEWAHMLIKALKDVSFDVFCISPDAQREWKPVYEKFPNVDKVIIRPLIRAGGQKKTSTVSREVSAALAEFTKSVMNGATADLRNLVSRKGIGRANKGWLASREHWRYMVDGYRSNYREGSFAEYFWAVSGLSTILLDSIPFIREIPQADVYHSLSSGFAGFAGSMAKAKWARPLVVTEQGLYLVERRDELSRQNVSDWYRTQSIRFSESLVKTSYEYADRIVPPCYSHTEIEKQMGAKPEKIVVINNGIETDRFAPFPGNSGTKLLVGCFARVVPIKGITTLINAAKIVCDKCPADFVVVGEVQDQEYFRECQELVAKLGLGDRFKFTGHANPVEWYHKVDVFTLSSNSEGVPYALLEAMSCGLPCVCTAVGGIPEILADGIGFVVPRGQPEALARALGDLLENRELRTAMGQRGIRVAREKYTIEEEARSFRSLYEGLVK